jgi:transcription elongation factor Elf1
MAFNCPLCRNIVTTIKSFNNLTLEHNVPYSVKIKDNKIELEDDYTCPICLIEKNPDNLMIYNCDDRGHVVCKKCTNTIRTLKRKVETLEETITAHDRWLEQLDLLIEVNDQPRARRQLRRTNSIML